jgi:hypothetical protein
MHAATSLSAVQPSGRRLRGIIHQQRHPNSQIDNEAHAMTPTDFLHSLEEVLRQRRLPFSRAAAIAFVESCWELIDDGPDVWFWSERFVDANGAVETAAT